MSLATMKKITAMADDFNRRAEQFAEIGSDLSLQRDLIVGSIRDTGVRKDIAESMVAKIKFEVTMPEPDLEDAATEPAGQANDDDAAVGKDEQ